MPRRKRYYLPGTAFHLIARTNRGENFFQTPDRRDFIVGAIDRSIRKTDIVLHAFAVMSNHIHLVVRQGNASLAQLMHPLLREVARGVHRWETGCGHIFARPFYESPCKDPMHLRHVIAYVNLNAEAAGVCQDAIEYDWTSHAEYCGRVATERVCCGQLIPLTQLFASEEGDAHALSGYLRYIKWQRLCAQLPEGIRRPQPPVSPAGDAFWLQQFRSSPVVHRTVVQDLRDIAQQIMKQDAPGLTVEQLRWRRRTAKIVKLRTTIILRAVKAGHRNVDIAKYLDVSQATVSRVASGLVERPPVRFT